MKERNPCPKLPPSLESEVKRELNEIAAELLQQVNSATAGQGGTASSRVARFSGAARHQSGVQDSARILGAGTEYPSDREVNYVEILDTEVMK
jgi:hypothetical protein